MLMLNRPSPVRLYRLHRCERAGVLAAVLRHGVTLGELPQGEGQLPQELEKTFTRLPSQQSPRSRMCLITESRSSKPYGRDSSAVRGDFTVPNTL